MQYRLKLAYDGTSFSGWQEQKNRRSVCGTLRQVLETIAGHPIDLQGASRTDAGVHARGQIACFHSEKEFRLLSINQLLPDSIAVLSLDIVQDSFHPSLDALQKEYRYYLSTAPYLLPEERFTFWHYPRGLDVELIRKAALPLLGARDFSAFCHRKRESQHKDFMRSLSSIEIQELGEERFCFVIKGQRFLHKMVRILVGTLVYVGKGKMSPESVALALNREQAGVTAPPQGLFLQSIDYPPCDSVPQP